MELLALGISHRTAPVERREKASLSGPGACRLLQALAHEPAVGEAVALSTCNRTEVYATVRSPEEGRAALSSALVDSTRISQLELARGRYVLGGTSAARHLFRVAASLDSMVIGESEIQGQVRGALSLAEAHGTAGPALRELFRHALVVGKRVRRETGVGRGAVSVSSVAVELAVGVLPDLARRRALLVGAGRVAESTARALLGHGLRELVVANRSPAAADDLAERFGGRGAALDAIEHELAGADIVICSTDSPAPVLTVDAVRRARASRLLVIDIAVPRDVEAAVRGLPRVVLRDIDDLERVVQANLDGRRAEAERAEAIVARELDRFPLPAAA